ncbi:Putative uncharacterized protein [Moritella viscosa]|uniref:hypothetical protein n=1 Tax=Moritella viscosa TaxID=80854 RepID=UPI0009132EDC|nr:hypothetical protein [Moritella viscosa]SGY86595.1 Putative uncharacterized protein [Moritella viscosa]
MDWYKLFQIAIPSISAGGTAVLGCYLYYFKKKFETYGDIAARLEQIDKLEEIEKRLVSAKFDVQMERIDEILKLEKAKSEGSSSVEFEYHQRKEDLDGIYSFCISIADTAKLIVLNLLNNNPKINNLTQNIPQEIADNEHVRQELLRINLKYEIYFEDYTGPEEFSKKFQFWRAKALKAINLNDKTIIKAAINQGAEPCNAIHSFKMDKEVILDELEEASVELFNSFSQVAKKIKNK